MVVQLLDLDRAYRLFPIDADCIAHLERVRWHGMTVCPYCNARRVTAIPKERRHHCNNCNTTFSVTVRTVFHRTRVPLQKWFVAIDLIINGDRRVTARQLASHLKVNKNTAWYLVERLREAVTVSVEREFLQALVDDDHLGGPITCQSREDCSALSA